MVFEALKDPVTVKLSPSDTENDCPMIWTLVDAGNVPVSAPLHLSPQEFALTPSLVYTNVSDVRRVLLVFEQISHPRGGAGHAADVTDFTPSHGKPSRGALSFALSSDHHPIHRTSICPQ